MIQSLKVGKNNTFMALGILGSFRSPADRYRLYAMTFDSSCPDRPVFPMIHVQLDHWTGMSHWVELGTNFQTRPCLCIEKNEIEILFLETFFTFCKMAGS